MNVTTAKSTKGTKTRARTLGGYRCLGGSPESFELASGHGQSFLDKLLSMACIIFRRANEVFPLYVYWGSHFTRRPAKPCKKTPTRRSNS
jgi:hypothetical protein